MCAYSYSEEEIELKVAEIRKQLADAGETAKEEEARAKRYVCCNATEAIIVATVRMPSLKPRRKRTGSSKVPVRAAAFGRAEPGVGSCHGDF